MPPASTTMLMRETCVFTQGVGKTMAMLPPDMSDGREMDEELATRSSGPISLGPMSFGPISVNTRSRYEEAHRLACAIEDLLTPADAALMESEGYGPRLARALARNLIDHLADLKRSRVA
jgi:hypothetical protein